MEIQRDYKELLELFNAHNVDYVIVGGYALAFHGAPRFTGDIDLFVKPDAKNAQRILAALSEFGMGSLDLSESDFTSGDNIIQIGVQPVRVDIMTSITGVGWEKAESGKVPGNYGDTEVYFIGKDDFVLNKRALGRKRDLADLEALEEEMSS